jgi:hypothetical protein
MYGYMVQEIEGHAHGLVQPSQSGLKNLVNQGYTFVPIALFMTQGHLPKTTRCLRYALKQCLSLNISRLGRLWN